MPRSVGRSGRLEAPHERGKIVQFGKEMAPLCGSRGAIKRDDQPRDVPAQLIRQFGEFWIRVLILVNKPVLQPCSGVVALS